MDSRTRLIVGNQGPICTRIRWKDGEDVDPDIEVYRIEGLSGIYLSFPNSDDNTVNTNRTDLCANTYANKAFIHHQIERQRNLDLHKNMCAATIEFLSFCRLFSYGMRSLGVTPSTSTHTPSTLAPSPRPVTTDKKTISKAKKPSPPEHMDEFKEIFER